MFVIPVHFANEHKEMLIQLRKYYSLLTQSLTS
jgi:hypothetical protein